jgi:mycothiol synthase
VIDLPAGYTARGIHYPDDLDPVDALYAACDRADVGFEDQTRSILDANWREARFSTELDGIVVQAADGVIVAEGECWARGGLEIEAFIRVHPAHRGLGLGSSLVAWSERRAGEHVEAGARPAITNAVPATDGAVARLLTARGYGRIRTYWHMERGLEDLEPPPPPLVGIEVRPAEVTRDLPAFHERIEDAFVDHYAFAPTPFEEWRDIWMAAPEVDPGLFLGAWDGGVLVGALMGERADQIGWVGELGVGSPWRGRGIGEALLRASFAAMAARGLTLARLNVDAGNETGATRLYERVGMSVHREWHLYEKPLAASG